MKRINLRVTSYGYAENDPLLVTSRALIAATGNGICCAFTVLRPWKKSFVYYTRASTRLKEDIENCFNYT